MNRALVQKMGLLTDLRSFVKGLDFKAAGATIPTIDSEDEDHFSAGEEQSEGAKETGNPKSLPVPTTVSERKESKVERETKRKAEREMEKERERATKAEERAKKEENVATKLKTPSSRSPWVRFPQCSQLKKVVLNPFEE